MRSSHTTGAPNRRGGQPLRATFAPPEGNADGPPEGRFAPPEGSADGPPEGRFAPPEGSAEVVLGDAARVARALADEDVRPRLVYLDPPFAADRDFYVDRPAADGTPQRRVAYSDRWSDFDTYLTFLEEVLAAVRDLLAPDGSLLLHCDHRAAPYLAVACDRLFGLGDRRRDRAAGFRNELIWTYGLGGSSSRCYPKKHDTILWYSRGEDWYFDPPRVPATSNRMKGQLKKAPDVLAIPTINNMAIERTGYPTQKPIALLDLLVRAHTAPGDVVVDLFSGGGTTGAAASAAGRTAVVSDIGIEAVGATAARLVRAGTRVRVYGDAEVDTGLRRWGLSHRD